MGVTGNSYTAAIITGLLRMVGTFAGTLLLQLRVPRRRLLVASGAVMGSAMYALSATLFYVNTSSGLLVTKQEGNSSTQSEEGGVSGADVHIGLQAAIVVLIVIYMLGFGAGVGTVPWLLLGELCPAEVKARNSIISIRSHP